MMAKTIAIANHKGGVGKTTTAVSIGAVLASEGYRVLLVDLDAQANLTTSMTNQEPQETIYTALRSKDKLPIMEIKPNLHLCPSSLDLAGIELELASAMSREYILKDLLEPVASQYDFILLDCAPSLGLLTINAFVASDEVLIPISAEPLPYKGLSKIEQFIAMTKKRLNPSLRLSGILFTRWERSNVATTIEEAARYRYGDIVYKVKIRKNVAIPEATLKGEDIVTYAPSSNGAQDYLEATKEFIEKQSNSITQ